GELCFRRAMQVISCHNGRLLTSIQSESIAPEKTFVTGLTALDDLAPGGRFMRGAIHELLVDPSEGFPRFVAMILAHSASSFPRVAREPARGVRAPDTASKLAGYTNKEFHRA